LELVKGIVPTASRVAVLHDPADRSNVLLLKGLQEAAPALGLTLQPLEVRELGEFEGAFIAISRERADALFGAPGVLTFEHQKTVVGLAAESGATRTPIPAQGGQHSGDCGQQVMAA
jgi:ABC-type uncharacterized transport system substrate-binding protein